MAEVLKERFLNKNGVAWVRTHATDTEQNALCTYSLNSETEGVELGVGQITCPDCIALIKKCHLVSESEMAPEYENEFLSRKFEKH